MAGMSFDTAAGPPVLVTGGGGFIGSHLVHRLIERGCEVTCLVRSASHHVGLRSAGVQRVTGDITDRASVARALTESRAGVVFHVAGLVKALRAVDFERVNATGVENVAAACAERSVPPVLIVVSSLAAAGPCEGNRARVENKNKGDILLFQKSRMSPFYRPWVESDGPSPVSNYGRSKLAGEQAAARYAELVPTSVVRPPIVFGPGDRGVLEMFRPIARWGIHVVPGWGERRFSLVHVDDLVEGLLLVAQKGERLDPHGSPGRGIYYVACESEPTYAELGQAMAVALGRRRAAMVRIPGPMLRLVGIAGDLLARIRRRPGWVGSDKVTEALAGSWACSSAKARAHLGWSPAAALSDRLHETAQWYRQAGWL